MGNGVSRTDSLHDTRTDQPSIMAIEDRIFVDRNLENDGNCVENDRKSAPIDIL